ncbi:hypothetical protein C8J57DRAFT_1492074 [Mycena rebaudengoi]|nr:hypothetical protein C8J57DRAFT_1492074 [Mycena rebaudengoi]
MPADLWESEESVKNQSNFALARTIITPSDLERPWIYSRRVKSLSMGSYDRTLDLLRILEVMEPFLPQGILFPNLRQLDLSLKDERGGAILPYLSFAFIKSISLVLGSSWPSIPDLLFVTFICVRKLIQIEKLTLPMLDCAAYDHFHHSCSPLSNREQPDDTGSIILYSISPSGTHGFPKVVKGFSDTPLRSLNATTNASGPEHLIEHFFTALSAHLAHSALEDINLWLGVGSQLGSDIASRGLSHLLCFSSLHIVTIFPYGKFLLDDATVWDMAHAWPNLVQLDLTPHKCVRPATHHDARQSSGICDALPRVEYTCSHFDATAVPPSDEQPLVQKKLTPRTEFFRPR